VQAKRRAYRQRPDVKAKSLAYRRRYFQRPGMVAKRRARSLAWYHAHKDDPKRQASRGAYRWRPNVREKQRLAMRAYRKTRRWKTWRRAYAQRPDVRARKRIYRREYMRKRAAKRRETGTVAPSRAPWARTRGARY
jgi:hypothetical protein